MVLVAPHFIPSFQASVHRARLWAYYLEEFGWKPMILTTDPKYYEGLISEELEALLPKDLEVIRTRAIPTKPIRLVGDIGYRSMWWYRQALDRLARERKIDFVHFTAPAFSPTLLGPGFTRRTGIPYGIDYIDPWIPETPQGRRFLSKHWLAEKLSHILEPIALSRVRLVTGINEAYFQSALRRNSHLKNRVVTAGMPYGGSERDYEALDRNPRKPFLFGSIDAINLIYAGALVPKAFSVLDHFLEALASLNRNNPDLVERLQIYFLGTGTSAEPGKGHTVLPLVQKHGLERIVTEIPGRIGYLDVLNHLRHSTGILVIGSTEKHYSPSKIYQSVMARRPVLALLHEESTAAVTLDESRAGLVLRFSEKRMPAVAETTFSLQKFIREARDFAPSAVNWAAFQKASARESSRKLADALDRAIGSEPQNDEGLTKFYG